MPLKNTSKSANTAKNDNHIGETGKADLSYQPIIEHGEADKLSPKSSDKIHFQFARDTKEKINYLRITGNGGGGLHSKEWVPLEGIISILAQQAGHTFKSSVLKSCMIGKSSNNSSFLAAILRSPDIELIRASDKSTFVHQLVDDFDKRSAALLKRSS
ncbi:hypothetical protein WNY58_09240 [Neptuniibacter pectenicola]|uniref:Uncharacterized protein n=1 Tax=Neptuniibacter pectenicola TaxID=1806669 RepID=A0ABU9TS75_9GAMM